MKDSFPIMRIIYPMDFVPTVFVRVTHSDQTIFNAGVSFCADFCTDYLFVQKSAQKETPP